MDAVTRAVQDETSNITRERRLYSFEDFALNLHSSNIITKSINKLQVLQWAHPYR